MALSISFRWANPNVQVSNLQRQEMTQGLRDLGEGIGKARDRKYTREQQARRNAIEDEDRKRRMAEEDRKKQAYSEAAELMRGNDTRLQELQATRAGLVQQISQLKTELGLNG